MKDPEDLLLHVLDADHQRRFDCSKTLSHPCIVQRNIYISVEPICTVSAAGSDSASGSVHSPDLNAVSTSGLDLNESKSNRYSNVASPRYIHQCKRWDSVRKGWDTAGGFTGNFHSTVKATQQHSAPICTFFRIHTVVYITTIEFAIVYFA